MELDLLLSQKSIATLRSWFLFWRPGEELPNSKARLVLELRRAMLDVNAAHQRYRSLPSAERDLLKSLLRAPRFRWRGKPEREALLNALAMKGLLILEEGTEPAGTEVAVSIPAELGRILTSAARLDVRATRQLLSLECFLRSLPADRRVSMVAPWATLSTRKADMRRWVSDLATAESIDSRMQLLEAPLREAVQDAITRRGGVVATSVLVPERTKRTQAILERWRSQLEELLLGTIADLSFTGEGLQLRGEYLIVYHEVFCGFHGGRSRLLEADTGIKTHGEVLLDMVVLLREVLTDPPRVSNGGELFASARRALARGLRAADAEERLRKAMALMELVGLVSRRGGRTVPVEEKIISWSNSRVEEQSRSILSRLAHNGPLHTGLFRALVAKLRRLAPSGGLEARSAGSMAANRWLVDILQRQEKSFELQWGGGRGPRSLDLQPQIERTMEWLLEDFPPLGIVRMGRGERDSSALIQLTPFGAHVLKGRKGSGGETAARSLIVMPSFEIIAYPQEAGLQTLHDIERVAERVAREAAYRYRLTRQSLRAGIVLGLRAGDVVTFLEKHSAEPLPQNVRYSIEDWASQAHIARVRRARLLEAETEAAMDRVVAIPQLQSYTVKRVGPTILEIRGGPSEEELRSWLEKAGLHLRWA